MILNDFELHEATMYRVAACNIIFPNTGLLLGAKPTAQL